MSREPSFSRARRISRTASAIIASVMVVALMLILIYFTSSRYKRTDFSTESRAALSPRTRSLLDSLTNQVNVVVYYQREQALFTEVQALLREYQFLTPNLKVEYIDPERQPGQAQKFKTTHKLTTDKDLIFFESAGRRKFVYYRDLSQLDVGAMSPARTNEIRRTHFNGEMMFTSAIFNVVSARQVKAYFVVGHNEHQPDLVDSKFGYSEFARLLENQNMAWARLELTGTNDVPADCSLLIIAGPQTKFLEEELAKVEKYLNLGGRAMVLFNYAPLGTVETGLENLLAKWNVKVGRDVVLDSPNTAQGNVLILRRFFDHPIVRPLADNRLDGRICMLFPRSIGALQARAAGGKGSKVDPLVFTSEHGQAVTDVRKGGGIYQNPKDFRGQIPLMAAVETGSIPGVSARGTTRMVIVGDSQFLSNPFLMELNNSDLAILSVNWLLDRTALLQDLGPRPIKEYKIVITKGQEFAMRWLLLVGLPGAVLTAGLGVWMRRRI